MAEAAKKFILGRRARAEDDGARREILEGMAETRRLIHQAYAGFNRAGDPDLIESYVFEINSLQARYSYLLRRVKELDTEAAQAAEPCL